MCGICGMYNYSDSTRNAINRDDILKMNRILSHRGPDDEGVYVNRDKRVGLGHRRLSIIDIDKAKQPMSNENGNIWITFNGEIYNFKDFKEELSDKAHRFMTTGDTEALVHLYEEYGQSMLKRLNGIFAFAIWDEIKQSLFIARDHFGVKPLYYYDDGKTLIFASELKAILLNKGVRRNIDMTALDLCLTFRHTPSPYTLIEGIRKLEPGSYIVVENSKVVIKKYFADIPEIDKSVSADEWAERLRDAYSKAVERQMMSDVPIGISLSGGIDSGALLSIMTEETTRPVNAFTVGFELGEAMNEIDAASKISGLFSAKFNSKVIKQNEYANFFNKYMWYLEEPMGNESAMAYYFVANIANGKVKVLLNGQGADEVFAGYPRHLAEKYSRFFRFLALVKGADFRSERISRMLYALHEPDISERFFKIYSIISDGMKEDLYGQEMKAVFGRGAARGYIKDWVSNVSFGARSDLEKMLLIDARTSLPDNLLLCEDKMSMACGIEARVPYLDIELMKLIETIPADLKIKGLTQKYIHKRTCERFVAKDFIYRKKIGFAAPMGIWLGKGLGDILIEYIGKKDSLSGRYLNLSVISSYIEQHRRGSTNFKRLLFLLLSIEKWYRIFILGEEAI